ncbi:MAG: family 10 glycosylhydrolase [Candidatus Marinimicrobia bacterium]|nr:family 10 glycosylhydrolase [Candidatus Neomarinimicrobiota bacterium]
MQKFSGNYILRATMLKNKFLFLTVFLICLAGTSKAKAPAELRAVKITNVDSDIMFSDRNIAEGMAYLDSININTVLVCVWNSNSANGDHTLYPSDIMVEYFGEQALIHPAFSGRDPLQNIIVEAHARGIEVLPWYEMGFSTSWSQQGGHILASYPDWACKRSDGTLAVKNGFDWMSAIHPEVQDFIRAITLETCKQYDIDGIEYSDRIPAMPAEGGYENAVVELYKSEHDGASPPSDHNDTGWLRWRADKLTDWYREVRDSIKVIDEDLHVSSSPSVYPWSYFNYLQDPKTWMNTGVCDDVIPQLYRKTYAEYESAFYNSLLNYDDDSKVFGGVCLYQRYSDFTGEEYLMDPDYIMEFMELNRNNGVMGEAWFFYEGFRKQFRHFFDDFDQNCATTVGDTLKKTYYAEEARLPHRESISRRPKTAFISEDHDLYTERTAGWTRPASEHLSQMIYRGESIFYSLSGDTLRYKQDIPDVGSYNIYVYNPRFSNATQFAPYIVNSDTFYINQKDPASSGWHRLCTTELEAGEQLIVTLHSNAPDAKPVLADDVIALVNRNTYLEGNVQSNIEKIPEPKIFRLHANYPNPFNGITILPFSLFERQLISIDIIDLSGRTVKELFHGFREKGIHHFTVFAEDLHSGIYFIRMRGARGKTDVRKIILLK